MPRDKNDRQRNPSDRHRDLASVTQRESSRLRRLVSSTLRNREEAEDVLQDVLEEYVEAYDVGLAIESVGAWLTRVAQNKVLDRYRKKTTRESYAETQESAEESSGDFDSLFLRADLMEAIDALPAEQRDVFIQTELEGKTIEQIALETGTRANTLSSRRRYALEFLREYLKEIYDDYE